MRVRYGRGRKGDLLWLTWHEFTSVTLPDLTAVPEDDLRRCHTHAKREIWDSSGPHRMVAGIKVLDPIEAEMKRRGLKAVYWREERALREMLEDMIPLS